MPDFSAIIKRSIETAKNFKWLWIYGAILGGAGISGSNGYSFGGTSEKELENLPENGKEVLGSFTTPFLEWLKNVPVSSWVLLAFAILLAIVFGLVIKMVLTSWSQGALIYGTYKAHLGEVEVTLKDTSPAGIRTFIELIKLSLYLFLIIALFVIVPILIFAAAFAFDISDAGFAIGGLTAFLFLFLMFPAIIIGILISVYAQRSIVIHSLNYKEAFKKGWNMLKKTKKASLLMGLINLSLSSIIGFIGAIVGLILVGIPALVTIYPNLKQSTFPGVPAIVFIAFLFVVFIFLMSVLTAFINVFKYSNWNQLYYWAVENSDKSKEKNE